MKKSISITLASLIIAGNLVSCSTPSQKVDEAEANVTEAKQDLKEAKEEYAADIESYRKEVADKIRINNESIAAFKGRIEKEKALAKEEYRERIKQLEQKNTDMQKKMDDYKTEGKDQWKSFKAEFSHDMEELGKAFKDLTVNSNNK